MNRLADPPAYWARLDAFEGDGCQPILIEVVTEQAPVTACICALRT